MGGLENVKMWLEPKEKLLFYCDSAVEGHVNKFGENPFPNPRVVGGMVTGNTAITDFRIFGTSGGMLGGPRMMFEWITDPDYATLRVKGAIQYEGRALARERRRRTWEESKIRFQERKQRARLFTWPAMPNL